MVKSVKAVRPVRAAPDVQRALSPGWLAAFVFVLLPAPQLSAGTLTFNTLPPVGKYLSTYQEAGLKVTTRDCPETREGNPMQKDASGRHARFERDCMLLFTRSAGSGALRLSEGATSFYRVSAAPEETFDLVGFDLLSLSGTIEIASSGGARLAVSSLNPEYGEVRQDGKPRAVRVPDADPGWKGITWFIVRDIGGEAILDNLEFRNPH